MNCNFIFSFLLFLCLSVSIKGRPVDDANWDDSDSDEEIGPNKENGDESDLAEGTKIPSEADDSDNGNNNDGENGDSPPTTPMILVDDTKNEDNDDDLVSESQEKVVGDEVLRVPFPLLANSRIHELAPLDIGLMKIIDSQPRQVPALPYESWSASII